MESIYLVGSEEVSRAASSLRQAAEEMRATAGTISNALDNHHRFLIDWLRELEAVMERLAETLKARSDHESPTTKREVKL